MTRRLKLTARQAEIIAGFSIHRGAIDSHTNGPELESFTLSTVGDALELLGYDSDLIDQVARLIGAQEYLREVE